MLKNWIELIRSIWKAIFQFRHNNAEQLVIQQSEEQQNLQNDYNKIDAQHHVEENQSIQDIANKLNDRF